LDKKILLHHIYLTPSLLGDFRLNQAACTCLGNCITHQVIVLESCSNPQKTRRVFKFAMKKNFWFWISDLLSDAISGVVLGLFGPLHLALGPNHWIVVFCSSFFWKLG